MGLLPVVMQHVRYMVSISVSSHLHVNLHVLCLSTWSEKRVVLNLLFLSGLGQGCGAAVAGPSEILLDQSDLTSELAGIPLGKPGALSIESGRLVGP